MSNIFECNNCTLNSYYFSFYFSINMNIENDWLKSSIFQHTYYHINWRLPLFKSGANSIAEKFWALYLRTIDGRIKWINARSTTTRREHNSECYGFWILTGAERPFFICILAIEKHIFCVKWKELFENRQLNDYFYVFPDIYLHSILLEVNSIRIIKILLLHTFFSNWLDLTESLL